MSLITDKVFYNALKSNTALMQAVGYEAPTETSPGSPARIYNTAIPTPDDDYLNEPRPYIIITFDGMDNDGFTKDNSYEGDDDHVKVSIMAVGEDRPQVGELLTLVRQAVIEYFEAAEPEDSDFALIPTSYTLSASDVAFDPVGPCFYQTLTYDCDTNP